MRIIAVHHVQLAMPPGGEDAARSFYRDLLGLPEVEEPEYVKSRGGCWFEVGHVRIRLGVEERFSPAKEAHPAFEADDLVTLRQRLLDAGVEVVDDQPLPSFDRFYAYDPFGNRLEFLSRE